MLVTTSLLPPPPPPPLCASPAYRWPNFWSGCCDGVDATTKLPSCHSLNMSTGCGHVVNRTACHNSRLAHGPCVWVHDTCIVGHAFGAAQGREPRCPHSRESSISRMATSSCCVGREPTIGRPACRLLKSSDCSIANTQIDCHNSRLEGRPCVWDDGTCVVGHAFGAALALQPRCPHSHDEMLARNSTAVPRATASCDGGKASGDGTDAGVWRQIRQLIHEFRCHSAYLDIGSNIGVQIRKLYEPALYSGKDDRAEVLASCMRQFTEPAAEQEASGQARTFFWNTTSPVLKLFDDYFGPAPRCLRVAGCAQSA